MVGDSDESAGGLPPTRRLDATNTLGQSAGQSGEDDVAYRLVLARTRAGVLGMDENPVRVGRYKIEGQLGAGGMGVVYSARDEQLDRRVAIKLLHAEVAKKAGGKARLLREAQAMARLSHPNVAHVYEVGYHDDKLFVAMEFIEGQTLGRWGDYERTWPEIVDMHMRAGRGLAAAHKAGLIHRDYKPANVLVGDDGRPRVLDFGLARSEHELGELSRELEGARTIDGGLDSVDITATGTVLGTPAYMAPEQLRGEELDARADQFSFCVALFEALYGVRPFPGSTLTALIRSVLSADAIGVGDDPDVPRALRAILLKGLRRDSNRRFDSMEALLRTLQLVVSRNGRSRRLGWAAAGVVALGLGGAAYGLVGGTSGVVAVEPTPTTTTTKPGGDLSTPEDPWAEIVDASNLPPTNEKPIPGDPTEVTVHRLRNGLTVYIAPQPSATVVHAHTVVLAGESDELPGEEGVTGLLPLIVEAGSERFGTIDFEREQPLLQEEHRLIGELQDETDPELRNELLQQIVNIEAKGGEFFSPEFYRAAMKLGYEELEWWQTAHGQRYSVVPRSRINGWIDLNAEVLRRPVFRRFIESVGQEISSLAELEVRQPVERVIASAFMPDPDVHTSLAVAESLSKLPLDAARAFYERHYRPNNIALIFVGDVTPAHVLPRIEAVFGTWEPGPQPARRPAPGPAPDAEPVRLLTQGAPTVRLAFGLPSLPEELARARALVDVLDGPDGLLDSMFAGSDKLVFARASVDPYSVTFVALLREGGSHKEVEQVLRAALATVASGEISERDWVSAQAGRRFMASSWSAAPELLAERIAQSFGDREAWATTVKGFGDERLERSEYERAAESLLKQPVQRIYTHRGAEKSTVVKSLPTPEFAPEPHEEMGAFANSIVDHVVTLPEPQFLVAGRNYIEKRTATGRAILVRKKGPRFQLTFHFGLGVADAPLICSGLRAMADAARHNRTFAGARLSVLCGVDEVQVGVVGLSEEFVRLAALLRGWIDKGDVSDDDGREALDALLHQRESARSDAWVLGGALRLYGLRGRRSLAANMPSDDEIRAARPSDLRAALARLRSAPLDIGYVGADPDGFAATLSPPNADSPPREPEPPLETMEAWLSGGGRPRVLVVDSPGAAEIEIAFALRKPPEATSEARVLNRLIASGAGAPAADDEDNPLWSMEVDPRMGLRSNRPDIRTLSYTCPYDELDQAVSRGLATLRDVPTADEFAGARDSLERAIRRYRVDPRWIPDIVRSWSRAGYESDPFIPQWLGLPAVDHADAVEQASELAKSSPLVTVVADRTRLDVAILEEVGDVEWIPASQVIGDPHLDEQVLFGYVLLRER